MALKPVTFKIDERELEAIEREARAHKPPMARSEYVRDIVQRRHDSKPRRPAKGSGE